MRWIHGFGDAMHTVERTADVAPRQIS